MNTTWVHVHFLNRFSIEYIIFAKHGGRSAPSVIETFEGRLLYYVIVWRENPYSSIFHLWKLYLVFFFNGDVLRCELEDFLDITLIGSEVIHVIQGVWLFFLIIDRSYWSYLWSLAWSINWRNLRLWPLNQRLFVVIVADWLKQLLIIWANNCVSGLLAGIHLIHLIWIQLIVALSGHG